MSGGTDGSGCLGFGGGAQYAPPEMLFTRKVPNCHISSSRGRSTPKAGNWCCQFFSGVQSAGMEMYGPKYGLACLRTYS